LAASKKGKNKGLAKAGIQLDAAMAALRGAGGLEEATKAMVSAQKQMAETQSLLEAVVEDNQTLANEVAALKAELVLQREVNLQLIEAVTNNYPGAEVGVVAIDVRKHEERFRDEVSNAAEESSCEGT